MSSERDDSARAVIEQIWYRARINAFAHRAAAQELSKKAERYFRREIIATLLGILCVILVYQMATTGTPNRWTEAGKLGFTLASIALTLFALYESVIASSLKLDIRAEGHRHLLNSYQYIAQRAREVKWPELPHEDVVALLKDLERDFQLLKARGTEPDDHHFDQAHDIVRKISGDRDIQIAQSFEVGVVDQVAQHTGDPKNLPAQTVTQL